MSKIQTMLICFTDSQGEPGLGLIHAFELAYVFGNFTPYKQMPRFKEHLAGMGACVCSGR